MPAVATLPFGELGVKKKERRRMGPYKGARLATSLWFEDTAIFPLWQTSKQELFFFSLKCTSVEEGGEGGWSEDETIDLIMHACFLIHCSGGKGRGRG